MIDGLASLFQFWMTARKVPQNTQSLYPDADEQVEYCMMLLRSQIQVETDEPSEAIHSERLAYSRRVESRAA